MTGIESLNLSATSWASLNDLGITRCTRTSRAAVGAPLRGPPTGRSTRRAALGRRIVVGEDVIEVVAPPARRQAPDIGPLAVAVLKLGPPARTEPRARAIRRTRRAPRPSRSTQAHGARSQRKAMASGCDSRVQARFPCITAHVAERRARRARSWRPPRRRPRSPATCPSRARVRPCASASSRRRGEVAAGWPPDPRRTAASSSGPTTRTGSALEEARRARPGAMPALPSSPATLTSTRISVVRRAVAARAGCSAESRRDRVDQLDVREDLLDLAALQLADEVPAERRGCGGRLGDELLRAVLPQQRQTPPRASTPSSSHGDVLDGRQQLDVRRVAAGPLRSGGDLRSRACATLSATRWRRPGR